MPLWFNTIKVQEWTKNETTKINKPIYNFKCHVKWMTQILTKFALEVYQVDHQIRYLICPHTLRHFLLEMEAYRSKRWVVRHQFFQNKHFSKEIFTWYYCKPLQHVLVIGKWVHWTEYRPWHPSTLTKCASVAIKLRKYDLDV